MDSQTVEVKNLLEKLKNDGLVAEYELPYSDILSSLNRAVIFLTPTDDSRLAEIWRELEIFPGFMYRMNGDESLSKLEWRIEFKP